MKRNEQKMLQLIREEYSGRLLELFRESVHDIFESDMFDVEGHQLLSPGLKVRHKKSGYEYTVDHTEGSGDNALVYLRHPESPRFKPPSNEAPLQEGDEESTDRVDVNQVDLDKIMGNSASRKAPAGDNSQEQLNMLQNQPRASLLKVTKKEFEKEYEVK